MNTQMEFPDTFDEFAKDYGFKDKDEVYTNGLDLITVFRVKQWLEHDNKMTVEEYRGRMIQAFHNADCDELTALCVLPTQKDFEHLEWLLKNYYKPVPKVGHWIEKDDDGETYFECSECGESWTMIEGTPWENAWDYCPNCGCRMEAWTNNNA